MASEQAVQDRITQLLPTRWNELLGDTTPLDRRAKTLGVCASIRETLQLCRLNVTKDEEELQGKRGEAMRPDAAKESMLLLSTDRAGKMNPELTNALNASLKQVSDPNSKAPRHTVAQIQSLYSMLESSYAALIDRSASTSFNSNKPSLVAFEESIEQLAMHARGDGWSDMGLIQLLRNAQKEHSDPLAIFSWLAKSISAPPTQYRCGIVVKTVDFDISLLHQPSHRISVVANTTTGGRSAIVEVIALAHDAWAAARDALMRISSVLGSANIFSANPATVVDNGKVSVQVGEEHCDIFPTEQLARDPHHPRSEQIKAIIELAAHSTTALSTDDSLYQAVRNHHRALETSDIESSFVLLWSGLERMCVSATRPEPALRVTAELVSSALAFSKIRREVSSLSEALTQFLKNQGTAHAHLLRDVAPDVVRADRQVVGHDLLLNALIGSPTDAKSFLLPFYDDVRLTQWFFRLRRKLCSRSGAADKEELKKTIPTLIRLSKQKTHWQVLRVYRARNGLAHGVDRPLWLSDLARHANYFLTNLLAICINYASDRTLAPYDVLSERRGWTDAYLELSMAGDSDALSVPGMLRPSKLFKR